MIVRGSLLRLGVASLALASAACSILVDTSGLSDGDAAPPSARPAPAASPTSPGASDASTPHRPDGASGADAAGGGSDATTIDAEADAAPPIALVQALSGTLAGSSAFVASLTVTSGDLLVVGAYTGDAMGSVDLLVNDAAGNAWSTAVVQGESSCPAQVQIWYAADAAGGDDTITMARSAGAFGAGGMFVLEYAGVAPGGALDGHAGRSAYAPSATMTSGAVATTSSDLVVALFADPSESGAMIPGGPFRALRWDPPFTAMIEADVGAGPGPIVATASPPHGDTSACWVSAAAAFRAR